MDESSAERQTTPTPVDVLDSVHSLGTNQSDSDVIYGDDFEKIDPADEEIISKSSSTAGTTPTRKKSEDSTTKLYEQEKGELETSGKAATEKDGQGKGQTSKPGRSPYDDQQSDDSEPEPEGDHYIFTEDQQRAMTELMVQKEENGEYPDEPPEYNVKGRLKELNDELAKEPDPEEDDRKHRVGFKAELVDLVAPPPPTDTSDDDESARKLPGDEASKRHPAKSNAKADGNDKKQFVVERDGKFDVLAPHELTASERAMLKVDEDGGTQTGSGDSIHKSKGRNNNNNSTGDEKKETQRPAPQPVSRPSTAKLISPQRHQSETSVRPKSAGSAPSGSLDSENTSLYAMSSAEKERARERARLREKRQREQERRHKEEEEYRRKEAEDAFQAWLEKKEETIMKCKEEEKRKKESAVKSDKLDINSEKKQEAVEDYPRIPYLEAFEPIFRLKTKENEEAFQTWLKSKQGQVKREKLLKKRQEQEIQDGYYVRSREECDKAYREWLRKKYAEVLQQRAAEKQRNKSYRSLIKKTRRNAMLAKAIRQSQAFRYVDYYGYRY